MSPDAQPLLCLRRARLELDRTLRSRELVGRAVLGELRCEEYAQLLAWLAALLRPTAVPRKLLGAARADLRDLAPERLSRAKPAVVELFERLIDEHDRALAGLVLQALLGTSWTDDAAEALTTRFHGGQRFLGSLSSHAYAALGRLAHEPIRPAELYAFTELSRGAVLGLLTQLEALWPAPTYEGVPL